MLLLLFALLFVSVRTLIALEVGKTPLPPDPLLLERGFIRIQEALPREDALGFAPSIAAAVELERTRCAACTLEEARNMRHETCFGCYNVKPEPNQSQSPFLLSRRLLQTDPSLRAIIHSPVLARKVAAAMGMERLRLYHASAFIKRPGDGPSVWHQDAAPTPLDTDIMATLWIALADVEPECGLLRFVVGLVSLFVGCTCVHSLTRTH